MDGILMILASYAGLFIFSANYQSFRRLQACKPVLLLALAVLAVDYVIMALAGCTGCCLIRRILAG
jgi:DHA1 family tetracycline resistance protein-like MFS transporter